ncbi:TetR/AcrR family transcriptional regulator [Arthrobacter sp. Hz1]
MDRRILDAATQVILEQGYGRATMEHIADVAKAGKSTLYSRFPTKAELFAAVIHRSGINESLDSLPTPVGATVQDRLTSAGLALADLTLTSQSIALMRATSAESDTFPDIASEGFRLGFEGCARYIARSLADDATDESISAAMPRAKRFVELALHPLYMHAFFGADLANLRARARNDIPEVAEQFNFGWP